MSLLACCAVPHPPIILPRIGHGEERRIQATIDAYDEVARRIAALGPDTLVIMSPHAPAYLDCFHLSSGTQAHGDFSQFGDPEDGITVTYDEDLVSCIVDEAAKRGIPLTAEGERELDHGTLVPLHFISRYLPEPRIVRVGLSGLSTTTHYHLGQTIVKAAEQADRRIVFVASGDLSHRLKEDGPYGLAKEGPAFDAQITAALAQGDFEVLLDFDEEFCDAAGECGLRSLITMAGTLDRRTVTSDWLSYEGPFGVGYGVGWFVPGVAGSAPTRDFGDTLETIPNAEEASSPDPYIRLAQFSLEQRILEGHAPSFPQDLPGDLRTALPPEAFERKAGTFVSLHLDGDLRGCIGTIEPQHTCVGDEIVHNAVLAGTEDPRFDAVTPSDLSKLVYNVDVLGAPQPIDGPGQLDPKRYGVIVSLEWRRGLLLPDLEGVDTVADQVDIARRKAGIRQDEEYHLSRFEVVRHT
jgi:AmmeMemoRadiSam system protein A/AmmeMemoRadiSam system protein B